MKCISPGLFYLECRFLSFFIESSRKIDCEGGCTDLSLAIGSSIGRIFSMSINMATYLPDLDGSCNTPYALPRDHDTPGVALV